MARDLYFTSKAGFQAFVKKQRRTKFFVPVAQRYTPTTDCRHSNCIVSKSNLLHWSDSNFYDSDVIKVSLDSGVYSSFAFCYPMTREYAQSRGFIDVKETSP